MDHKESPLTSKQSSTSCFTADLEMRGEESIGQETAFGPADRKQTGGHCHPYCYQATKESRIVDIERAEKSKMASISDQAARMYASIKARNDAVVERLRLSLEKGILSKPLPTPSRGKSPLQHRRRLSPLLEKPPRRLNETFSIYSPEVSISSESSSTSVDTHTPDELRAISHIRSPVDETPALQIIKRKIEACKKTASDCSINKIKGEAELQPLANPQTSLFRCFTLLRSDDWNKKMDGMKAIQALAQHHAQKLKPKLHEVCLLLNEEVNNQHSAMACEAIDTIARLYIQLQQTMDPEVELTGRALLLKLAASTNTFIHQRANLALDAMVENCSHGRTVSTLLNNGLNHCCNAVRGSTAAHLEQVAKKIGADRILSAGRSFSDRFLIAVSKMSVDAAPDVRRHGRVILKYLSLHGEFLGMWIKVVPEKERWSLQKLIGLPA